MKTYQSQLPQATEIKPTLPAWVEELRKKLTKMFRDGFWYCPDCDAATERIEREQGLPAMCGQCGSVRLEWREPIVLSDGSQLIQPGDL